MFKQLFILDYIQYTHLQYRHLKAHVCTALMLYTSSENLHMNNEQKSAFFTYFISITLCSVQCAFAFIFFLLIMMIYFFVTNDLQM